MFFIKGRRHKGSLKSSLASIGSKVKWRSRRLVELGRPPICLYESVKAKGTE